MSQSATVSTAVLTGACEKIASHWNAKHTQILTEVTLRVHDYVKGDLGEEVVVTIPGGRVGNTVYEVSDMPVFVDNEEVLVFLWRHPSGKHLVTGALQGKLTIMEDKATKKKRIIRPRRPRNVEKSTRVPASAAKLERNVLLEDYINEIRSYVEGH